MSLQLEKTGWQVCAHRHTPTGTLPDISGANQWDWKSASIPFDAISWLHQNDDRPDPMVGFNDLSYRWTEEVDWVLRKNFKCENIFSAEDDIQLVIDGVDCYFELFLNGTHVGHGRNQFRKHVFDIDETILKDDCEVIIYIRSARNVNSMMEAAYGQLPAGYDTGRVHARRSQCLTGWDWTPRLSSVSLLKTPIIQKNLPVQISNPHAYITELPRVSPGQEKVDSVQLHATVDITSRRRASGTLIFRVVDLSTNAVISEKEEILTIKPKATQVRRIIEISNARLWWSLGMGEQPMYRIDVLLEAKDRLDTDYSIVESAIFGIRTISVECHKDEIGESFTPVLNGIPIICRGANWTPVTMLAGAENSDDYRTLLAAAIGSGMNCLRVWGGGIYETDTFYDLCDQAGILVWQDFMFACAAYPTYREFLDEVEAEVIYQIVRLRNHPSLMLWCGNNENEWLHQSGGLKKGSEQKIIGENIWSHMIRGLVEDYDPSRYYHQSSPFGKNRTDYNDQLSGDRHSWEAWADWQDSEIYLQDRGRFISEFGFQALPEMDSIRKFAPSADSLDHPELAHHQRMIEGQERLIRYVASHYDLPQSLEEWVDVSQRMQAEILRRAVEHWRRNRSSTSGALVWQLHDSYPAISWSLIDYYRKPKHSWQMSRRFFAPVLLSMEILVGENEVSALPPDLWPKNQPASLADFPVEGGEPVTCQHVPAPVQIRLFIINDTALPLSGNLSVELTHSEDDALILDTIPVHVEPNSAVIGLTHDISAAMLGEIDRIKVQTRWDPDEKSMQSLKALGESIRSTQSRILGEQANAETHWNFSEISGLVFSTPLVDPKYYKGDVD